MKFTSSPYKAQLVLLFPLKLSWHKLNCAFYFKLTLRTVNGSRSAFACFSFKQSFFTFFETDLIKRNHLNTTVADNTLLNNTTHDNSIEESEPFKCKVPAKVVKAKIHFF